jgi:hypothetical protein
VQIADGRGQHHDVPWGQVALQDQFFHGRWRTQPATLWLWRTALP